MDTTEKNKNRQRINVHARSNMSGNGKIIKRLQHEQN